jgi:hypothetical protein
MREVRDTCNILVAHLKGRDHSKDIGVNGKIILKWILEKLYGKMWTGFI